MLLAIDTATRATSIALYRAEGIVAELTWQSRHHHTVETMTQIARLLELSRVAKSDLRAIGVALGPGSFTGLRVGMSIAKGLAFGHQIPLIGVPTLDAIASAHARVSLPIWAMLEAGRGRYHSARYAATTGTIARVSDYALTDAPGIIARAERAEIARALFCGDVSDELARLIAERLGDRAAIASPATNARRAGFLAELAWARFARGEFDDTAALAPLYLQAI
ncbi:MAG: tRNA (adenosine(37)-N6)-threonylcarbamoyltransferase complex dimerization subunit type 1 TsaB [Chloroflexi bacterium]|nr:tRNA (adenosine(37)-N6)-threonylcarbamoyltransferase complex dimerization subunit type 1 TsaB [Chloroflexota bacterium]